MLLWERRSGDFACPMMETWNSIIRRFDDQNQRWALVILVCLVLVDLPVVCSYRYYCYVVSSGSFGSSGANGSPGSLVLCSPGSPGFLFGSMVAGGYVGSMGSVDVVASIGSIRSLGSISSVCSTGCFGSLGYVGWLPWFPWISWFPWFLLFHWFPWFPGPLVPLVPRIPRLHWYYRLRWHFGLCRFSIGFHRREEESVSHPCFVILLCESEPSSHVVLCWFNMLFQFSSVVLNMLVFLHIFARWCNFGEHEGSRIDPGGPRGDRWLLSIVKCMRIRCLDRVLHSSFSSSFRSSSRLFPGLQNMLWFLHMLATDCGFGETK